MSYICAYIKTGLLNRWILYFFFDSYRLSCIIVHHDYCVVRPRLRLQGRIGFWDNLNVLNSLVVKIAQYNIITYYRYRNARQDRSMTHFVSDHTIIIWSKIKLGYVFCTIIYKMGVPTHIPCNTYCIHYTHINTWEPIRFFYILLNHNTKLHIYRYQ